MKLAFYFSIFILIISCNKKELNQNQSNTEIETAIKEIKKVENTTLKNFTYEDIARYTMAAIMIQPSKIIKVTKKNEL